MSALHDSRFTRRSLLLSSCLIPGLRFGRTISEGEEAQHDYSLKPVPFDRVDIADDFWAPRMEVNRAVSIWHCFERMREHDDFGSPKLIEGAAYMIAKRADPKLEQHCDQVIDKLVGEVGGRISDPDKAVRVSGHFLEAAAAYFRATGKRRMLDAALEDANVIAANFGPGKKTYISQHEGQKIGLVQLYRETGDQKYWALAKFFLDERGKDNYPRTGEYAIDRTYAQDHEPVIRQDEAVGHCVRAMFLYIPLTDSAAFTGRPEYGSAADKIWEDAVYRKTYLTGSIGSVRFHEQFGAPYELPNLSAWNETCASYGSVVWNHRMFLLHRDSKYIDVMERVLYNGFADGVSLKGDRFFYQNPLKSFGNYERFDWIDTPCCPPNVVRLVASVASYIYAQSTDSIYVNLFVGSKAKIKLSSENTVTLTQNTRYPWDGGVRITVDPDVSRTFRILIRIPGWARNQAMPGDLYQYAEKDLDQPSVAVNGRPLEFKTDRGYIGIERRWQKGDVIQLDFAMPVRRVQANANVQEDRDMVAIERGPLVYCAEWPDNGGRALHLVVPDQTVFRSEWRADLLMGVQTITGDVQAVARTQDGTALELRAHELVAIPYHAWANRGMGEMAVWLPRKPEKAWLNPIPPRPIASVRSSGGVEKSWTGYNDQNSDIGAIYDGKDPLNSADESYRYFKMRPPVGSSAWIEYEFQAPARLSSSMVYWFDDKRFCRLPKSWRVLYKDGEQWKPVAGAERFSATKDRFDKLDFEPVLTTGMRLEVEPTAKLYKAGQIGPPGAMFLDADIEWREFGLLEWRVS